jgi:hypothetical protein
MTARRPKYTILDASRDHATLGHFITDHSTREAWGAFNSILFGLPPENAKQREIRQLCTRRTDTPTKPFKQAVLVCGRRSGKSFNMAMIATWLAVFKDYSPYLAAGEKACIAIVAGDRD